MLDQFVTAVCRLLGLVLNGCRWTEHILRRHWII